ncbi:DUF4062 domain-containing protein [Aquirhabdus sp.]|uniref:DUF4062 domain-containing protein n=1 Tax=Aquirhabdus sp. TaxID=2824160 RepID=UPI00396C72C0
MIDKRYHVFISTTGADMQAERSVLAQTLASLGFFSWGLETRTPLTTAFARRQIDDCDYFVLMLGSRYGELSASGVSYVHLEYIYAITKQKPVFVILHESPETRSPDFQEKTQEGQVKFQDFRRQLQRERDMVVTFREPRELEVILRHAMPQLTQRYPSLGWVRPNDGPMQALQAENDKLRLKVQQLTTLGRGRSTARPTPVDAEVEQAFVDIEEKPAPLEVPVVRGDEVVAFDYRVHAYQDGNFRELRPRRQMSWNELLMAMGPGFRPPAPEEDFARIINDYLNISALGDVKDSMPRAHATARCQINIRALHAIKMQLKNNKWIVPVGRDEKHRILWGLSTQGEGQLNKLMAGQRLETGS